ncbi:LINE-1 retrotransposable element ORF2 protein [Vitis vinifera]|uniref:LINE-1 retrotransposable element ORF2 protein n=1 Tax=Vitis vinifera TaxID=29760 RepID=A0A438JQQ0_VITVI|nr:LINE-1 retrotransposable element ORF2 protein [Vitis vinifera]
MEVIQPACPNQMCESVNPLSASSEAAVNLGGIAGSPKGEFQIEGPSPGEWQKVRVFHMKIISWNTRGLGSKKKRRVVKNFLSSEKPDVVMIQETKKEECDRRLVGSVWSVRNKDWAALPASGASGGILIIWDSKKLRREEVVLGSFSVSIKFAMDECESLWLSAVYGPNNSALRKDFWVELSDIAGLSHPRWCVGGDFNVIRRSSEKLGGSRLTPCMKDFDEFIRDCELIDSPLRSASYTWSNMQENPVCKRLDRFLYSNEWEQVFPQSLQGVLPRWTSDHWPIVLETNPFKWGPTPFRFENMWLQHSSFKENFGRWWSEFQGNGWEGHKFMRKLQFVKAKLKEWNKTSFGELSKKKKDILAVLANFDSLEQEGGLSHELLVQRALSKGELEELILREEIHWRQKLGKFIKELENESGLMLNNPESIKEEILRYFEKLYASSSGESWRVEGLDWSPIDGESASRLEFPFTEEEIYKAIFQMDRDKAPGPDGFTIAVFQDCWDVIKEDLVRVFAEFHRSGIINQSTNASFIVLLPKKSMSRRISDFRPISLITSLYKIIAKVLAGRLRGVLHETIHSTQGAFVQGRQILDAVLIANEIVDEKRRTGEEGVVFKIDFEKAYDHVSWDFLDHVLEMKGFSLRWRKWMRGCLSSVSYAVLVNGNAKGWVKASRGLRQGDPLSPFLFTIVADVLSRMLLKAEERNVLEGFRVGRNRTRVSHLQFADDTIFFSSTREEDLMTLKSNHLSRLAEMLDCKASGWPILYLGLPLGGNPKASGFWDPVIERISRRLDGWQKAYLSFGGRITLIQSCLTHMPCYFLSLFKIPASMAAKIERMQREFLWSGVGEGKRDHLVNWDVVCKPKSRGGLGFGKISMRNVALLGKWLWRYPREGSALWHQVILSIYGSHSNGWDVNNNVRWSHRCPWKAIALVFQEFSKFTRFVVGDGDRIRFWDDLWWGDQPLGTQYPRLLSVVTDKNAPISSILGYSRPFSWNFNFRRNLTDSEIEDLESLMRSLDRLHISPSVPDKRSWSISPSGLFTVKSFFLALSQYFESPPVFPTKFVWNSQVPFKVKSFVWLVAHKKLNTNDLLQLRRPHKALSPNICKLCMKHGETVDHLFLHCSLTKGLWHRLFQLAKMDWVSPRSISDMFFTNFNGFGSSKRGVVLWQDACIALMWVVWRERNARIFEDKFAIMGHNNVKSLDYRSAVKDTDEWPSKYSKLFIENVYVPDYDKGNLGESGTDLFYSVRCSNYEIKTKIHSTKHVCGCLGWGGREISETAGLVEEAIYFQRRENHSNSEYIVKYAHILDVFTSNAKSVGNGRRVKFWKDIWWGNFALCNSFPSLYAIASSKEAWVEEFWDTSGVEGAWSPRFSRPFNDWEVEEVERLLLTIRGARLIPLMEDRMMWKVTSNGIFSVKSLYNDLSSRRAGLFPHGLIWNPSVPSKVGFFAWEASWGKVLTMDQLKKRGWALANRCFLCCEEEESIDHILIHCSRARALWEFLFALFGVFWVLPSSARDTLIEWRGFMLGKKHRKVWKAAPLCLFWAVWMERNRIAFDNEDFSVHRNGGCCRALPVNCKRASSVISSLNGRSIQIFLHRRGLLLTTLQRDLQTLSTTRRSSLVIRMDFGTCLQFLFLVAVDPISMAAKTQKFTEPTIT